MNAVHSWLIKPEISAQPDERGRTHARLTAWQEVESIARLFALWVLDHNSVSSVVPSRTSCADIGLSSEDIDKLAFAFVTPLGSEAIISRVRTGMTRMEGALRTDRQDKARDRYRVSIVESQVVGTHTTVTPCGAVSSA